MVGCFTEHGFSSGRLQGLDERRRRPVRVRFGEGRRRRRRGRHGPVDGVGCGRFTATPQELLAGRWWVGATRCFGGRRRRLPERRQVQCYSVSHQQSARRRPRREGLGGDCQCHARFHEGPARSETRCEAHVDRLAGRRRRDVVRRHAISTTRFSTSPRLRRPRGARRRRRRCGGGA